MTTHDENAEAMSDILYNLAAVKGKEFAVLVALLHSANLLNISLRFIVRSAGGKSIHTDAVHKVISEMCANYVTNVQVAYGLDRAAIEEACDAATRLSARCGVAVYKPGA